MTNRLAAATSPYLLQHAQNPVDWWEWEPAAFAEARRRDVPILLSIGYSACHWCHVMAHESFEDAGVAEVINARFVAVKVDREERPDVDAVYMEAVQAVSGSGGWPMTVFLTPDGRPFFAGTYFPRDRLLDLLQQIYGLWSEQRGQVEEAADRLAGVVRSGTALPSRSWASGGDASSARSPALLASAADALLGQFDPEWGGFGRAPKFPQPPVLEMLLLASERTGRAELRQAVTTTLDAMASGGIYDHLGGGFARYSTDREWLVPHFEKMLYDNALLLRLYVHAYQATRLGRYRQVAEETIGYLTSAPMRLASGGLASAEDADSEGIEGKFYLWDHEEVVSVGGSETVEWYGVTPGGNWEGHNILVRPVRGALARPPQIEAARSALLARRNTRVRPGLDYKVLTEWNAMAIAAFAEAGPALGMGWVTGEAERLATFLLRALREADGRWLRSWQGGSAGVSGHASHLAYGSDYAWLVEAFTRLAEATGRKAWIAEAVQAADALLDLFWDGEAGGFRTAGRDAETLVASPIDTHDGALPSANSVAAAALTRLGALTGEARFRSRAGEVVEAMAPALGAAPAAFMGMVSAAVLLQGEPVEVAVIGDRPDLVEAVWSRYRPSTVLAWGEPYDSPLWEGRTDSARDGAAGMAYVCRERSCLPPASTPSELTDRLDGISA